MFERIARLIIGLISGLLFIGLLTLLGWFPSVAGVPPLAVEVVILGASLTLVLMPSLTELEVLLWRGSKGFGLSLFGSAVLVSLLRYGTNEIVSWIIWMLLCAFPVIVVSTIGVQKLIRLITSHRLLQKLIHVTLLIGTASLIGLLGWPVWAVLYALLAWYLFWSISADVISLLIEGVTVRVPPESFDFPGPLPRHRTNTKKAIRPSPYHHPQPLGHPALSVDQLAYYQVMMAAERYAPQRDELEIGHLVYYTLGHYSPQTAERVIMPELIYAQICPAEILRIGPDDGTLHLRVYSDCGACELSAPFSERPKPYCWHLRSARDDSPPHHILVHDMLRAVMH